MKLLLLDANIIKERDHNYIGLGLAYLASFLSTNLSNLQIRIVNQNFERELDTFNPELVGISSVSVSYSIAKDCARLANARNIPVVVGGYHISALPDSLSEDMALGVIGEGERTMLEICKLFQSHGFCEERLKNIAGIVFRSTRGNLVLTEPRSLIRNIDTLPYPARDLLPEREQKEPIVYSSRGCPYRCIFCSPSRFWVKTRYFSAEYVINELHHCFEAYRPENIYFADDLFIGNRNRLRKIVKMMHLHGLTEKLSFDVPCRANIVDKELIELLKRMNVRRVHLGLESGSDKVLKYLKGGNVTVADNARAIRLLSQAGIRTTGNFIIGSPNETDADLEKTIDFIQRSPLTDLRCYVLCPLPGTPLWDYALENSLVSHDMDWSLVWGDAVTPSSIVMSKYLNRDELAGYKKRIESLVE